MVSVSVSKKIGIEKSIGIGFEKILVSEKVSVLVSKKFGIEKSIGIGIGKILVSKKVSVLVSEKNWYRKKYRYRYRKKLVSEKSFGFGFVQILGFVTHCLAVSQDFGESKNPVLKVKTKNLKRWDGVAPAIAINSPIASWNPSLAPSLYT